MSSSSSSSSKSGESPASSGTKQTKVQEDSLESRIQCLEGQIKKLTEQVNTLSVQVSVLFCLLFFFFSSFFFFFALGKRRVRYCCCHIYTYIFQKICWWINLSFLLKEMSIFFFFFLNSFIYIVRSKPFELFYSHIKDTEDLAQKIHLAISK
ncbi:hypothetical protein HMI54_008449 [Coelomomyces lativittatus]|nr:hypothetical protein HMI54_008449 [Coelomomyces lativittatus]